MDVHSLLHQFKDHTLAVISLIIALIALSYNTWRDEVTEKNRNYRMAAFEVLKNLGELQIEVNTLHFNPKNSMASPYAAWGRVALITDLSQLLPPNVQKKSAHLLEVWQTNVDKIRDSEDATERISQAIDASREAVLQLIAHLK
jgi:hypothetical protein